MERDETGRKFANERQISDWSIATAQSRDQLLDADAYKQVVAQQ